MKFRRYKASNELTTLLSCTDANNESGTQCAKHKRRNDSSLRKPMGLRRVMPFPPTATGSIEGFKGFYRQWPPALKTHE